jgi:hypothetical protein
MGTSLPSVPRELRRHLQREECDGFWTAKEDVEPRLFVLASYAAGEDPGEVADNIRNFNVSDIVGVESTILIPSTSSPLK